MLIILFASVVVVSTSERAFACRVSGGVCAAIAWCMGPDGREFAGPLRTAAQSGDPTGISSDTQACQSKYGQQHGKDYSKQASGCSGDEFKSLAKKALNGLAGCRR
jgi:hypothetical protein